MPGSLAGRLVRVLTRPLRLATGEHKPPSDEAPFVSDRLLRTNHDWPQVDVMVVAERLRYFGRVHRSAPSFLRALMQSPGGREWREEVIKALARLNQMLPAQLGELPSPHISLVEWERLCFNFPVAWKNLIRKFIQQAEGFSVGIDPYSNPEPATFQCDLCPPGSKLWRSVRALRCHQAAKHKVSRPAGLVCTTSTCPSCGNDYRTRQRLLHHLEHGARKCRLALVAGDLPHASPEALLAARQEASRQVRESRRGGPSVHSGLPFKPVPF